MKHQRAFVAERPLAQHCPELLHVAPPPPADLRPELARFSRLLARGFSVSLGWLTGADAPLVRANPLREVTMAELSGEIAPLAANSLLAVGEGGAQFLASLDAEVVLRLVDRAFGGRGDAPAQLPEAFPLSAELLISRLETTVVAAITAALGEAREGRIRGLRRDGSLRALAPFADSQQLTALTLDVEETGRDPWRVTLAFPAEALAGMFGPVEPFRPRAAAPAPRDPLSEPFADLPLTLTAVLVDMRLPMSALADLRPGQILPVAVARNVPLRIGDETIAHGTVGQVDDCVAVQLTKAF